MSEVKVFLRQPSEFKYGSNDEFSIWFAKFTNFADAAQIAKSNQFTALCSYLDNGAFSIVRSLEISDEDKAEPDKFKPLLEKALGTPEKIPPRLALKYRTQKPDESLSDFAIALGKLASKAEIAQASKEETLVDSFCTGVRDTDLSIKLLETNFGNLSLALEQAQKIEGASKIRNFVRPITSHDAELEVLASSAVNRHAFQPPLDDSENNRATQNDNFRPTNVDRVNHLQGGLNRNAQNFQPGRREHSQYPDSRASPNFVNRSNNYVRGNPNRDGYHSNQGRAGSYSNRGPQKRCWYCNRPGHLRRDCRTRAREQGQNFPTGPSPRQ
jgi:hypothetical protein